MANALARYVEMASGLTSITVQKAERLVQRLVKEGEVAADRAERAVTDLVDASQRNRQALVQVVRHEVERAVDRLNLVRRSDLEQLEQRLLAAMRSPDSAEVGSTPAKRAATAKKTAATTSAKKTAAKKTVAKKTSSKKAAVKKASTGRTASAANNGGDTAGSAS